MPFVHEKSRRVAATGWAFSLLFSAAASADEPSLERHHHLLRLHDHETLTGDWGGGRTWLESKGFSFEGFYTLDVLSNVAGGLRRGTDVLGEVDLMMVIDGEKSVGWKGGKLFFYGLGNHGGNPTENVGDLQVASNIEAFDTWKLYEAWVEQAVFGERLSALAGLYDVNSEFDVIPAAALFLNSSHGIGADLSLSGVNGPSIFPTTSLGARLAVEPVDSLHLRAAVLDGVAGDPEDPRGTEVLLDRDDGLLLISELSFESNTSGDSEASETGGDDEDSAEDSSHESDASCFSKYALGVWGYTTEFDDFFRVDETGRPLGRQGSYGVYLFGEQRVYCESRDRAQGLSLYGRFGFADERVNPVDIYCGGGGVYRGAIPGRDKDEVGFAVAAAHLGSEFRQAAKQGGQRLESWEITLELTYSLVLTPWFSVQPDLQYVISPGGDGGLDDALLVGVRGVVAF